MSSIGIVVLATGKYFPLGLRLVHRISHFYKGNSKIHFHFFSDANPLEYIDPTCVIYHETPVKSWTETVLLKFKIIEEVAKNQDYDYYVYVDADSNLGHGFEDKDFISNSFILKHFANGVRNHYEQNELSSAYIKPSQYPEFYYHSCYFGGCKASILKLVEVSAGLLQEDAKNGIVACAEDESYINKYFWENPPETIFDTNEGFPFVGDKGVLANDWGKFIKTLFTEKQYEDMLAKIKSLKGRNVLWDIQNSKVIELPL